MNEWIEHTSLYRVWWGLASDISLVCANLLLTIGQWTPWEQRPFCSHMLYPWIVERKELSLNVIEYDFNKQLIK